MFVCYTPLREFPENCAYNMANDSANDTAAYVDSFKTLTLRGKQLVI